MSYIDYQMKFRIFMLERGTLDHYKIAVLLSLNMEKAVMWKQTYNVSY